MRSRHASLNKFFRIVWNHARQCFMVVAENAKGRGKITRKRILSLTVAASLTHGVALASDLPTGGTIVAGSGSVSQSGNTMTITQDTARMAANWQNFSIGQGSAVNFVQPSASAVALNRVLGSDVSVIQGALNANGQVFLINPNGVLFTPTAQVNVGSLVASTLDMKTEDFMAGNYKFEGASGNAVINQGSITAANGGTIALIAARISNEGNLTANDGNVLLGAGNKVILDLGGPVKIQVEQGALDALIEQGGAIKADGGLIMLTAKAANTLTGAAVNNSGVVEARTLESRAGRIFLGTEGGMTTVSGTLDVSSESGKGGQIVATGDRVLVESDAHLTASGTTGGGEVLIGGDWQGSGSIQQATGTVVQQGALLEANATERGDGGTVVAWSDIHNPDSVTRAYGTFLARGGADGGDGGRIETSGHWLDTQGVKGDASALKGRSGQWLFDPHNVTISSAASANGSFSTGTWTPSSTGSTILNTAINTLLEGGTSVTVTTGTTGSENGDITVSSAITKSAGDNDVTLTLQAANSIVVDQSISNTGGSGKLHVVLDADNNNDARDGAGIILLNNDISTGGGDIQFGTDDTILINGVDTKVGGDVYVAGTGARTLTTAGGDVTVNGEMILANTSGLTVDTANGNVTFGGLLNSGNSYASVNFIGSWTAALGNAVSGDGSGIGHTYLATITSRLENAIAGRAVNYQPSWLGGRRVTGIGTNAVWRWVTGPEGQQDGGNGLPFFTQNGSDWTNGVGGSAISGRYSNWNPNEPNNYNGANLADKRESALQFTGNLGKWNDLPETGSNLNYYVKETNLAASPLTVAAGTGTVTFSGAVGTNKALASLDVSAATIAVNGGAVTTEGLQTYTGNVTLGSSATTLTQTNADTDFTLQASKSISNASNGNATLAIKTTRNIVLNSSSSISSPDHSLGVTLLSDSDATNGGYIALLNGSAITTTGGHLWLGGGSGSTTWNGLTVGDGYAEGTSGGSNGIFLQGTTISSGGGHIAMHGKSRAGAAVGETTGDGIFDTNTNSNGIRFASVNPVSINSGTGTILLDGVSRGTNPDSGLQWAFGIQFEVMDVATDHHNVTSSASSGDAITLIGVGSTDEAVSGSSGIWFNDVSVLNATGGGNIVLTGTGGSSAARKQDINFAAAGTISAGSGNLTVNANTLAFHTDARLSGTGNLHIQPRTAGTTIGIGDGAGTLSLPASYFSTNFVDGFSGITVGSASQTGNIAIGATTFNDDLTLHTQGAVTQTGAITNAGTLNLLGTGGAYTLTNIGNDIGTLTANTGSVSYVDANALTLGTVTATGVIDIATSSEDLTLTGAISTTNTTSNAVTLNAGKSTAAGTATGGNIVISGSPTISTGSGGRATLYTGSVSGSTGLLGLGALTSGSGRFRYNSDESTTNYTSALGTGVYAVYREQPIITVTPDSASITYGDVLPTYTPGYGTLVNGDTDAGVTGTASWTTAGNTSSSGHKVAGSHNVTYSSGLTSSLGYGFVDNSGSTGELTVSARALTITGFAADNKVYDGNTTAVISAAGALSGVVTGDTVDFTNTGATFNTKDVATADTVTLNGVTLTGTDNANYSYTATTTDASAITAKALSATIAAPNKVYDGTTTAAPTFTITGGLVGTETVTATGTASFNSKDVLTANLVTANTAALADGANGGLASNYSLATGQTVEASITAKALSASIAAPNKVYDGTTTTAPTFTITGGLVGTETVTATGTASFNSKNVLTANLVTANTTALADGANGGLASNYSLTAGQTVAASITAKALTVSATAANKVYDGGITASVILADDRVTNDVLNLSNTAATFADKNVADGKTVTVTGIDVTGTDAGNYTFNTGTTTTADITPKALMMSGITASNKVYDGSNTATVSTTGATYTGLVANDAVTVATTGLFSDKNVANGKTVTLTSTYTGADVGNYSITDQASTTADITARALTVSATAANKVYDGGITASVILADDRVTNDLLNLSNTAATFTDKNVANGKTVTVTGIDVTGTDAGNYTFNTGTTTTADITPKTLTMGGITASNKVYDGTTTATVSTAGATYTGLVANDAVTVATTGLFSDKNVANSKTVTLSSTYTGADVGNYSITNQASTTADITARALTVSAIAANKVYDGDDVASVTLSDNRVANDLLNLSNTAATFADKNVADGKTVTVTGIDVTGTDAGNYIFNTGTTTTADITPKALMMSGITASNKVYDGSNTATVSTTGATYTGLVANDAVTVGATGLFSDKNVADGKTVTLTSTYTGADVGNYSITDQASTTANITARALTVSATAADKVYDGGTAASVILADDRVANDLLNLSNTAATFADKNVADGKTVTVTGIDVTGTDAGNYTFNTGTTTTADITPKALMMSGITASNKVYDGSNTATVSTAGATYTGLVANDAVTVATTGLFSDKNVANGKTVTLTSTYTGADVGNYSITDQASTTADITAKALTVSGASVTNKTYDGTTAAMITGSTLSGVENGDAVTFAQNGNFSDKNVGNLKTVTAALTLGGTDAGNYSLIQPVGLMADITARPLNFTGNRTEDGTMIFSASQLTPGNVVDGDSVLLGGLATVSSAEADTYATFTSNSLTVGNHNYTVTGGNVNVGITAATTAPQSIQTAIQSTQSLVTTRVAAPATSSTPPQSDNATGLNLSDGLAFVEVADSKIATEERGGDDNGSGGSTALGYAAESGRNTIGFLRVLVVDGGIRLPAQPSSTGGAATRNIGIQPDNTSNRDPEED